MKRKISMMNIVSLLMTVLCIYLIITGLFQTLQTTHQHARESLEKAIQRDIMECYALEGRYPESLDYIKEHYGLIYDDQQFYVSYQPIGENIQPDVTIVELK